MKSTHTNFKSLTYDAQDNSAHRAKADRKRVKKFKSPDVNKKRFKQYIPEQRLWLYADDQRVLDRMVFLLREPVIQFHSKHI